MSIHEQSVRFAAYLAKELDSDQRQELRMAYGLEILLGEIIKLIVIISLSWILGILPEVLTITVFAGILRLASGGEHCSEYYRCLIGGTAWFLFLGWGVHFLNTFLHQPTINLSAGLLFSISIIIILKYAPGETENKPISSEAERKKFKNWSVLIMFIYGFIIILSANISVLNFFVMPIAIGIIAQAFTVSPAGYGFIHFVDRVLDFSKG
jgi:accessory gene regulator B